MEKYEIEVKEVLSRTVIVEADSLEEAIDKVGVARDRCEIVLEADDFDECIIEPSPYAPPGAIVRDDEDISSYQIIH